MPLVLENQMHGLAIGQVAWRHGAVANMIWPGNFSVALWICQIYPPGGGVQRHFGQTVLNYAPVQRQNRLSI